MNQCNFTGRITKDLELKQAGQHTVLNFGLAVSEPPKNGEKKTTFVNIAAFGKTAEVIKKYAHKGDIIQLVTKVQVNSYDKNGQNVTVTNFVVDKFFLLPNPKREVNGNVATDNSYQSEDIPF